MFIITYNNNNYIIYYSITLKMLYYSASIFDIFYCYCTNCNDFSCSK